jgi:hypothetical protein
MPLSRDAVADTAKSSICFRVSYRGECAHEREGRTTAFWLVRSKGGLSPPGPIPVVQYPLVNFHCWPFAADRTLRFFLCYCFECRQCRACANDAPLTFKLTHSLTIYALVDGTNAYQREVGKETAAKTEPARLIFEWSRYDVILFSVLVQIRGNK